MVQLKWWSKEEFGGRQKKLDKLVAKLKDLRFSGRQYSNGEEIKMVKKNIQNILIYKEIYWKQRSRAVGSKNGTRTQNIFMQKPQRERERIRFGAL